MRIFAHVWPDGSIDGFVAAPEGEAMAMAIPPAGCELCEIIEHDFTGDEIDVERLAHLRADYTVDISPATGRLVRRTSGTAQKNAG